MTDAIAALERAAAELAGVDHPAVAKARRAVAARLRALTAQPPAPRAQLELDFEGGGPWRGPATDAELAELERLRPRTRADCLAGGSNERRPCPFIGCQWHLGARVQPNGTLLLNARGYRETGQGRALNAHKVPGGRREVDRVINLGVELITEDLPQTCALDVAADSHNYAEIADLLGVDCGRVRQIADSALVKLRAAGIDLGGFDGPQGEARED